MWPQCAGILVVGLLFFDPLRIPSYNDTKWARVIETKNARSILQALRDEAYTDMMALKKLKALDSMGNTDASFLLGTLYDPTIHAANNTIDADWQTAVGFYRTSAEKGNIVAKFDTANLLIYNNTEVKNN